MEKSKGVVNFVVRYNSDPVAGISENHCSDILSLTDTDERGFDTQNEAILFLSECTSPITCLEELVPELKNLKCSKNFKFLLPERNIKPKHQLMASMDYVLHSTKRWE
jgi:hypothetical protein